MKTKWGPICMPSHTYTPVVMAQACMADALSCIDDHKITPIDELLPMRYTQIRA